MGILNKLLGIGPVYSAHGATVDLMLETVHWFMLALFIGWSAFLTYVFIRFHKSRQEKAIYSGVTGHASSHLEIGVVLVELVLLLGFAFPLWAQRTDDMPAQPDVAVRAIAAQFNWNFHYAGADGKFGNTSPFFYSGNNPAGIDTEDPNGKDDIVASQLSLPLNKSVVIGVTSRDVIHNLALVGARMATDANPGQLNRIWFIPTKIGKSEIICGQLCGSQHGVMKGDMDIVSEEDFKAWLGEQNTFGGASAAVATAPAAAPAAPAGPSEVTLGALPAVMKFDKTEFTVAAGQPVKLIFKNDKCPLQHNIMVCKPGSKDKVGALGDKMLADPAAMGKFYIPDSPDVLFKGSKLVGIGQSDTLEFTAPAEPGDYVYICTFPGHWRTMNGVMKVIK